MVLLNRSHINTLYIEDEEEYYNNNKKNIYNI